jgi:hypothetical protein
MVRLSSAVVATIAFCGTTDAFVPSTLVRVAASSLKSTIAPEFTSESAKKQIGNDSFKQKSDGSCPNGPGKKNEERLKIGIIGLDLPV